VPRPVLDILTDLASRVSPPGVLLERDENFPEPAELERELGTIRAAVEAGEQEAALARASSTTGKHGTTKTATGAGTGTGTSTGAEIGTKTATGTATATATGDDFAPPTSEPGPTALDEDTRQRLGLAQAALLSALVAGTPVPEGFDRVRLGVQARALAAKRADVVAKVAPELPLILGNGYRTAFIAYAQGHPMHGGYRQDALDFAEETLLGGRLTEGRARRELRRWWLDRSSPAPRPKSRLGQVGRVGRTLIRR
jgi:hypothetical protein